MNTDKNAQTVVEQLTIASQARFHSLDELMEQLNIKPKLNWRYKPRRWYKKLPKYFRKRAKKYGLSALLWLCTSWLGLFLLAGSSLVMIITPSEILDQWTAWWQVSLGIFSFLGGMLMMMFGFTSYDSAKDAADKAKEELRPEKKKELIIAHCRSLIDDYRERVTGEDSNIVKSETRLKKDVEEVVALIEELEDLMTSPEVPLTPEEEQDLIEQLAEAKHIHTGRLAILTAHNKGKQKFLNYFKELEKRLARVDVSLALKRVAGKLAALREKTEERENDTEQAFLDLITSFVGDAQRLQQVIEGLQAFSRASFEVEIENETPHVLMSGDRGFIDLDAFFEETIPEVKTETVVTRVAT